MDICAASELVLTPEMGVQLVETTFKGPLPPNTVGLLLGRSSVALRGLLVIPGVIDSDYTGTIKIMVQTSQGTLVVNQGDRIAQLLLLPSLHRCFPSKDQSRGDQGFGSSGTDFMGLHMTLQERPMLTLAINGRQIKGLLDTGADRSIISQKDWPSAWPTNIADQTLQGLGFVHAPKVSASLLNWRDEEGHVGQFQPFVLQLPVSLWGRDILSAMDITLTSGCSEKAQAILKRQGYVPGKGLGVHLQGRTSPIPILQKQDKKGLGFS